MEGVRKFPMYKVVREGGDGVLRSAAVSGTWSVEYSTDAFVAPHKWPGVSKLFVFSTIEGAVEFMWSEGGIYLLDEGGYAVKDLKVYECEVINPTNKPGNISLYLEDEVLDVMWSKVAVDEEPPGGILFPVGWSTMLADAVRLTQEVDWKPALNDLLSEGLLTRDGGVL